MKRTTYQPPTTFEPVGNTYSHGIIVEAGRTLYVAGQTPRDKEGNIVCVGDSAGQTRQVLENLRAVVEGAGGRMEDIAKTTVYITNVDDRAAVRQTMPKLVKEYIKTGKVKLVFRDFSLVRIHKQAFKAAEEAQCAGDQGKYWEFHDGLFENPKDMKKFDISPYAKALGLDMKKFKTCLDSGVKKAGVREDLAAGGKAGVRGTPTFLFAYTESGKPTVKTIKRIRGARPFAGFKAMIDGLLAEKNKK